MILNADPDPTVCQARDWHNCCKLHLRLPSRPTLAPPQCIAGVSFHSGDC
jgi:hypothetical protein